MKVKYTKEEAEHLFFTSDTHFDHKNIMRYCNRPFSSVEEMNNFLIKRWNVTVGPDDTVFHLGDVTFGGNTNLINYVSQLNGHIVLIKGNHDKKLQQTICDKLFDYTCQQLTLNIDGITVFLNHFPFLCFSGTYKTDKSIQLFGHIHSGPLSSGPDIDRFMKYGALNQYDVGVDNNHYTPISWNQILEKLDYENIKSAFKD